ncbi:MAG: hypothetical protein K6F31_05930 [Acetatifactor sp.]|nr:hypothetical protein [Acetatifactor sp.]
MSGLPTSEANSIVETSEGFLRIGTNDSGVYVQHQGREWHFGKKEGLKSASVRSIEEDESGNVYVATTHGIALVDQSMHLRTVDEPQVNEEYIRMLRRGADGLIYGLTQEGNIFTMKDGAVTANYEGSKMGIRDIHAIYPDPQNPGYLYLGTQHSGLYYGTLSDGMRTAAEAPRTSTTSTRSKTKNLNKPIDNFILSMYYMYYKEQYKQDNKCAM